MIHMSNNYEAGLGPLEQAFEMPARLVAKMRARGPNHEDLRLARVEWKVAEEAKFVYLVSDPIRLRQRYASVYLEAAKGAKTSIASELMEWDLEELYDARDSADQMLNNDKEGIVVMGKMLLSELERQIAEIQ